MPSEASTVTVYALLVRMRATLRADDVFGRYGGEEFAVVLPDSDAAAAGAIAERLRSAVAADGIAIGRQTLGVTISVGVAVRTSDEQTLATLLAAADAALYQAKAGGRNRVALATPGAADAHPGQA